jgi:type II secretory pathway component PulM
MIAGMSAREKKMAAGMLAAMVLVAVFLAAFFVQTAIGDIEEENEFREETLRYIALMGPKYQEAQADQREAASGQEKPPPLRTLVDGVVNKIGMPDPDTKELPDQSRGESWTEYGVEVAWREVSLEQLTKFMEELEGNRRRFPIAITRLEVRKRRPGENIFDVTMAISTYEKIDEAAPADAETGEPETEARR